MKNSTVRFSLYRYVMFCVGSVLSKYSVGVLFFLLGKAMIFIQCSDATSVTFFLAMFHVEWGCKHFGRR